MAKVIRESIVGQHQTDYYYHFCKKKFNKTSMAENQFMDRLYLH